MLFIVECGMNIIGIDELLYFNIPSLGSFPQNRIFGAAASIRLELGNKREPTFIGFLWQRFMIIITLLSSLRQRMVLLFNNSSAQVSSFRYVHHHGNPQYS